MKQIILLIFLLFGFFNLQAQIDSLSVDSIVVYHIPYHKINNTKLSYNEEDIRNFSSIEFNLPNQLIKIELRRDVIIESREIENFKKTGILNISTIEFNEEAWKSIEARIVIDVFVKGKIFRTIVMDYDVQSVVNNSFYISYNDALRQWLIDNIENIILESKERY